MNEFAKLSSFSSSHRLNTQITLTKANCRDLDHKEKLELFERKLSIEYSDKEKKLKRSQKWNHRAEKNLIYKQIYNKTMPFGKTVDNLFDENLSPSVDEWLEMSLKKRNASNSSAKHLQANKKANQN